jgi:hypothetical protein
VIKDLKAMPETSTLGVMILQKIAAHDVQHHIPLDVQFLI